MKKVNVCAFSWYLLIKDMCLSRSHGSPRADKRHAFNSNSVTVIIAMENTDPYCLTLFAVSRIYPQDKASQVSS